MGMKFNKDQFGQLIGKSSRWIGKLISDEGLPIESGGGKGKALVIDSEAAIQWLIDDAVAKAIGNSDDETNFKEGTLAYENYHTAKAKRIQEQVKAAKDKKASIELEELKPVIFEIANIFGQQCDALGGRLSSQLASENDPAIIKSKLLEESRRIRAQTAERILTFVDGYASSDSGYSESAAAEIC